MSDLSGVATVANGDCAVVRFSTADYAPSERLEALHEVSVEACRRCTSRRSRGNPFVRR